MIDQCQCCVFGPNQADKCEYYHGGLERRRPMKRKSCEGCVYYRPLNNARNGTKGCHYCLDTGKPRGCPIAGCVRKVKGIPDARTNPFDARRMR